MWRDDARILDMLLAAKELANFTNGVTFEAFEHNRLLQHGAVRLIELTGETTRKHFKTIISLLFSGRYFCRST